MASDKLLTVNAKHVGERGTQRGRSRKYYQPRGFRQGQATCFERRMSQVTRLFAAFGGPAALRQALEDVGAARTRTVLYKWNVPRSQGGTGGVIPTSAVTDVATAGRFAGVDLSQVWEPPTPPFDLSDMRELKARASKVDHGLLSDAVGGGVWRREDWTYFHSAVASQREFLRRAQVLHDDMGGPGLLAGMTNALEWLRLATALEKASWTLEHLIRRLESEPGVRMVVYAASPDVARFYCRGLRAFAPLWLRPGTPLRREKMAVAEFLNNPAGRVVISPPRMGAPLHFLDEAIFVDATWEVRANTAAVLRLKSGSRFRFAALDESPDVAVQRVLRDDIRSKVRGDE